MNKTPLNRYDLISIGIILLIVILSGVRFQYLPQFVDAYYHLSSANGFIKSGGWVSWSWWDCAPGGRPQVYPPLYHFLLVFLQKVGFSGLTAVRLTEVFTPCVFFFTLWYVVRYLATPLTAFLSLLFTHSFFSFFASTSAHVPATLALIFGFWSWYFFKKQRQTSAALFMILSFYTHPGLPWIFCVSFLFAASIPKYRARSLRVLLLGISGFIPFLLHQARFVNYLVFNYLKEIYFIHFSIFIICVGIIAVWWIKKESLYSLLFLGYLVGSLIVFFKYPYRFFSAQGVLGLIFFSSLFFERYFNVLDTFFKKTLFFLLCFYCFFMHTTLELNEGNLTLDAFNSTYSNYLLGKTQEMLEFKSLFYPQYYLPLIEVTKNNSTSCEVVTSNMPVMSQIVSALSQRPIARSLLTEVTTKSTPLSDYCAAKIIVWVKPKDTILSLLKGKLLWEKVYENDVVLVFVNRQIKTCVTPSQAQIPFIYIGFLVTIFLFLLFCSLFYDFIRLRRRPQGCP